MLLGQGQLGLCRRGVGAVDRGQRVGYELFGQNLDVPVAVHAFGQHARAGGVDEPAWVAVGQSDDAPEFALADAAFQGEQHLAQPLGVRADGLGLLQDAAGLARWIEHALGVGQHDCSGALGLGMGTQQRLRLEVADLDAVFEHTHQHPAADRRRACGVAAVLHAHATVVADRSLRLAEVLHARQRQRLQMGLLLLEHRLHLATRAAVDARGGPGDLPVLQERVLLVDGLEAPSLERGGLGVADRVFHAALAVGIAHPGRVGDHAVVRQRGGVDRVE